MLQTLVSMRRAAFVLLLVLGCTSPTLPLPPPAVPTVTASAEPNRFVLRSERGALPNALVLAVNRDEALPRGQRVTGTLADEVGSYELVVVGSVGDVIDLSQETGSTGSSAITVLLK